MKKLALTIAVVFGIAIGAFAQEGGLFGLGRTRGDAQYNSNGYRDGLPLVLPEEHGNGNDYNATPVGSGIAVLIGFGAAYAMSKRRKK